MIKETLKGITIQIYAQPGAKKTELVGAHGGALKVKVAAPPVDGEANEELFEFLAKTLGISKRNVKLLRGEKSRNKIFLVVGCSLDFARRVLEL
ncbi:MAG: DUF167 domain-containing protein [Pseudobdellovibrionaceae bacterium]